MTHKDNSRSHRIVATGDLAATQRTIGGNLAQFDAVNAGKAEIVRILSSVGLPEVAADDPSFPISLRQDFEILNAIRKLFPSDASMEVNLFRRLHQTSANMFGVLGLAWQSAPSILDAIEALFTYPQANWGRSQMLVLASEQEERIEYYLDKSLMPFDDSEDIEGCYRYSLLLELTAAVSISLDIVRDRSLVREIHLPFPKPDDWGAVEASLDVAVQFEADIPAIIYRPGYLRHVPRGAHEPSFRLAMKLVGKESAILAEESSIRDRVVRWLWASSPPLKKAEIAKLLGLSERSLTRQLAAEGVSYNQLFTEVQSERAQHLLGNGKLRVSEVAYRMGYSDPAAFTRAFVAWSGITPSEWRAKQAR